MTMTITSATTVNTQQETSEPIELLLASQQRYNDTFNALKLVEMYGDVIRYNKNWGWIAWDGQRWEVDAEDLVIERATQTLEKLGVQALQLADKQERGALLAHVNRSLDYNKLTSMVKRARSHDCIKSKVTDFDTGRSLFNAQNGTIDLQTGDLHAHNPADMITRVSPTPYDPEARSTVWDEFLQWVTRNDKQLADYLQRVAGYTLTGLSSEKCMFVCYGPGGNNGKTTLLEALRYTMGQDYAIAVAPETVTLKGGISGDQTRDNVALVGKRLVTTVEPDAASRLNAGRIKQIRGGDTLPIKPLYHEAYDYKPELKLWMATNARLGVSETGNAMFESIREIPFDAHISREEVDKDLPRKLEEAAPAILAWAVKGAVDWYADGMHEPPRMVEAQQDYRAEQDTFQAFLDECCEADPDEAVVNKDLLTRYNRWRVSDSDAPELNQKSLPQEAERHGYKRGRVGNGRGIRGLRLKPEEPASHAYAAPTARTDNRFTYRPDAELSESF